MLPRFLPRNGNGAVGVTDESSSRQQGIRMMLLLCLLFLLSEDYSTSKYNSVSSVEKRQGYGKNCTIYTTSSK